MCGIAGFCSHERDFIQKVAASRKTLIDMRESEQTLDAKLRKKHF